MIWVIMMITTMLPKIMQNLNLPDRPILSEVIDRTWSAGLKILSPNIGNKPICWHLT
jgi:hypothetical protein